MSRRLEALARRRDREVREAELRIANVEALARLRARIEAIENGTAQRKSAQFDHFAKALIALDAKLVNLEVAKGLRTRPLRRTWAPLEEQLRAIRDERGRRLNAVQGAPPRPPSRPRVPPGLPSDESTIAPMLEAESGDLALLIDTASSWQAVVEHDERRRTWARHRPTALGR